MAEIGDLYSINSTVLVPRDIEDGRYACTYSYIVNQFNKLIYYIKNIKKLEDSSSSLYPYFIRVSTIKLPISYESLLNEIDNLVIYLNKRATKQNISSKISFNRTLYTDKNLVECLTNCILFCANTLKI